MLEMVLEENGVNVRSVHVRPQNAELSMPSRPQNATVVRIETQAEQTPSTQNADMDEGVYL